MMPDEEDFEELRRRLMRLEVIVAAVVATSGDESNDEALYLLTRFFRDDRRRGRFKGGPDLEFFVERLIESRERPRASVDGDGVRPLRRRIEELEAAQRVISASLEAANRDFSSRIQEISESSRSLSKETHAWLSVETLGLAMSEVKVARFIPLRVYISEDDPGLVQSLATSLDELIRAFEFEFSDEFPETKGSWYKKWFARTKDLATQPEVAERLGKLERALELKGLGVPQADIDDKQASAVAKLMKSLDKIPNAAIQSGSILLIKVTQSNGPIVQVRTLTHTELLHLENNQKLLSSPESLLEKLSLLCNGKSIESGSEDVNGVKLTARRKTQRDRALREPGQGL